VLAIRFVFNAMALNFLHVFNVLLDISYFLKLVQLFVLKVFMVTHLHQHVKNKFTKIKKKKKKNIIFYYYLNSFLKFKILLKKYSNFILFFEIVINKAFLVFHLAEPAKISKTGVFLVSDLLLLQTNFFSKTLNV
jgi:hypothetical protein